MTLLQLTPRRIGLLVLVAAAALAAALFALRTYRTFVLLQSAHEAGAPESSSIRGWMTLPSVPTGLSTAVAGSLVSIGGMGWAGATLVAVAASMLGDLVGYGLGRALSAHALERRGRWIGYTSARQRRVQRLFERLGGATVFLTRTLVSHLSSVVNLLAGASRYALANFLAYTLVGRLVWTSAYLGLGYAVGTDLEAAAGFLGSLSLLLLSLAVLVVAGFVAWARPGSTAG